MKQDLIDAAKHIGVFLVAFLLIYLGAQVAAGSLFIVPPVVCGAGGWIVTKKRDVAIGFAGLGLLAGAGFFFAL